MTDNNNKAPLFLHSQDGVVNANSWSILMSDLRGDRLIDPSAQREDIPVYCFSLATGRVVFGVRLEELHDSYLVGLPALLFADDNGIHGRSLVAKPVIRLFKDALGFVCRAPDEQGYFYYRYLYSRKDSAPEFFTEERIRFLERALANKPPAASVASVVASGSAEDSEEDEGDDSPALAWKNVPYNKNTRH